MAVSRPKLNVYLIDKCADSHADLYRYFLAKGGYDPDLRSYTEQEEGINNVDSLPDTIILAGVVGNGLETALGGLPWARLSPSEVEQIVHSRNPDARIIFHSGVPIPESDIPSGCYFMPKPASYDQFIKVIRETRA